MFGGTVASQGVWECNGKVALCSIWTEKLACMDMWFVPTLPGIWVALLGMLP